MRRVNWWLVLPIWLICALIGFTVSNLLLDPTKRTFLDLDYWKALLQIEESLRVINAEYVDLNKSRFLSLSSFAISGITKSLDTHSRFFDSVEFNHFNEDTHRVYAGIGIMIRKESEGIIITRVFPNSPAENEGLSVGEIITHVDNEAIQGLDLDDVSVRIKGLVGTKVELVVQDIKKRNRKIEIERNQIKIASLDHAQMDDNGILYLHLLQFTEESGEEIERYLSRYKHKNVLKGLILDLRDNSGGLLKGAIDVSSLFLPKGKEIVSIRGRELSRERSFRSLKQSKYTDIPLVILINQGSASASEIVAGSLSKLGRAILVGEKTFGKGSVQTIYPLKYGAGMKLTTAMYFFSDGTTIHETGILPDHDIPCSDEIEGKLRLQRHAKDAISNEQFQKLFGFQKVKDTRREYAKDFLMRSFDKERSDPKLR